MIQEELIHNIGSQETTFDLLERPAAQSNPWLTQDIVYGPSSLVMQMHNSLLKDKTYAYDALNQLTQEADQSYAFDSLGNPIASTINQYNQILETSGTLFKYDENGNPTRKISTDGITEYTYDALNRLTNITYPDGKKTHYFYDPLSRLISEQKEGSRLFFLYDKAQEIGSMNAQGTLQELKVIGLGLKNEIGKAIAIEIQAAAYAPLHDFQGHIIALISSNKKILETYQIDAFGRENPPSPPLNPWRFCSKRSLGTLIFFGERFYDPSLGRWLTPDPSGFADGANLYVYVLNSPLNRLDLFGLNSDPRLPQEMLQMQVPLYKIMTASIFPAQVSLNSKGFISGVPMDWVVSSGHWNKLKFSPQERETGTVNIVEHFHELTPQEGSTIGLITSQNGICTTQGEMGKNIQALSSMIPEGTLIIGAYNPTKGIFSDCNRTFKERKGKDTPIVVSTRQFMVVISDILHKVNPDLLWLHIAHSEGGAIGRNAISGMTEEQKEQLKQKLYIFGIGPARPIPLDFGKGVTNVYSKQDFITGGFALKYRNDPKYDVRFVPCRSTLSERTAYIADHAILGGTYQWEQSEHIRKLRQKSGFYDGKTN